MKDGEKTINTKLIEIILVDDGLIVDSKASGARSIGLKYLTDWWVIYVDSDDITRNGYIKLILTIIHNINATEDTILFNLNIAWN